MDTEETTTLYDEFETLKDAINDPVIGITRTIDGFDLDPDGNMKPLEVNDLDSLREDAEEAISALQELLALVTLLEKPQLVK